MRFPPILFGYLKYGSFFSLSKIWCTGSLNTVLTTWAVAALMCPTKPLRGLLLLYLSDLKFFRSWGITLVFPFPCYWSSSTRLYLSIQSMSQRTFLASFIVNDFLKSCSAGKYTLNVLIATSSKFPSISLNISQYLSEYVFRVSPSYMAIDSKESKERGTLLEVINQAPKALVSLKRSN